MIVTVFCFMFIVFSVNLIVKNERKENMKTNVKKLLIIGTSFIIAFALWTILIQTADVRAIGVNGTNVGLAAINSWFHSVTGVNMTIYTVTDWLGLVPIFCCMVFCAVGFVQLVKRKNLFKVDSDILISGIYYVIVILCYLIFEMIPVNYRPILIDGFMEASYPSSTTLLVLSVMPTVAFLSDRYLKSNTAKRVIGILTALFSCFMVIGRLVSGVHWLTDIIGSVFLSVGLFYIYKAVILLMSKE